MVLNGPSVARDVRWPLFSLFAASGGRAFGPSVGPFELLWVSAIVFATGWTGATGRPRHADRGAIWTIRTLLWISTLKTPLAGASGEPGSVRIVAHGNSERCRCLLMFGRQA